MHGSRSLLALAILLVAGCAADPSDESRESTGDPALIVVQFVDVTAPMASDCAGANAREAPPARFPIPADARWARVETTFASGKLGVEALRGEGVDARRIGFGAGPSPVVVVMDEAALAGGGDLVVRAFACEGTPEQAARVTATFRRAPP